MTISWGSSLGTVLCPYVGIEFVGCQGGVWVSGYEVGDIQLRFHDHHR